LEDPTLSCSRCKAVRSALPGYVCEQCASTCWQLFQQMKIELVTTRQVAQDCRGIAQKEVELREALEKNLASTRASLQAANKKKIAVEQEHAQAEKEKGLRQTMELQLQEVNQRLRDMEAHLARTQHALDLNKKFTIEFDEAVRGHGNRIKGELTLFIDSIQQWEKTIFSVPRPDT